MALDYVPGRGWVFRGPGGAVGGGNEVGGADEAARVKKYHEDEKAFRDAHYFNYDRDYRDSWGSYFGSESLEGNRSPSFLDGPNSQWGGALQDRMAQRQQGILSGHGHFESRVNTANADYQKRLYARNNAIEDMFRRGYSQKQISDHLEGRQNANDVRPDWADYGRYGEGDWRDNYFIGKPGIPPSNGPNGGINPQQRAQRLGTWGSGYKDGGYGMLSPESEQMRQALQTALEKKLLV